jgi:ATP-dependent RNA helicase DeaD
MPPEIRRLADQYLYDPVTIKVKAATLTVDTVEQFALEVKPRDKADALVEVLRAERPDQAIVFVRTKIRCDQLYRTLRDRGMNVRALHGDMTQGARDGVMISFKDGRIPFLVATDVAARGLDVEDVTHVVNFDPPDDEKAYVHRVGRTARAGRTGTGITLVTPDQRADVSRIAKRLNLEAEFVEAGMKIAAPRSVYSTASRGRGSLLGKRPRRRF